MLTSQLLLSSLDITEDEYSFKAQFILSALGKSKSIDIGALDSGSALEEIKTYFEIEDTAADMKNQLMEMIMEKANIGSNIIEGENYEEAITKKLIERSARNFDMA